MSGASLCGICGRVIYPGDDSTQARSKVRPLWFEVNIFADYRTLLKLRTCRLCAERVENIVRDLMSDRAPE